LERERCGKQGRSLRTALRQSPWLLATVLIVITFSASGASAQALKKDTKSAATASGTTQATSGKELFQHYCASCHFTDTRAQKIGPGLKGLYPRLTFSDGKRVTDASLSKWIETGGKNMPGFEDTLKPEQIRELISYIKTL
jgi:cytochrome c